MALPLPSPDAQAASDALSDQLRAAIREAGGWLSFARFMELALYAPRLGYYAGGAHKFGAAGDFVTAPELTPLFAQAVAVQVAQGMAGSAPQVLEAGGGSGRLAADLLLALEARGALPDTYAILEVSGELAARQRDTIAAAAPHLLPRVHWLDRLPERWRGVVLGNEVLDAMPVQLVRWSDTGPQERGVALAEDGRFAFTDRPAAGALAAGAARLAGDYGIAPGYLSEINLAAEAWMGEWGRRLEAGLVLLFDYGFPGREYYHPDRRTGTLMCHYRHHAHPDPFFLPGLQDITAHVDFTAMAEAAFTGGLDVLGYTGQAAFLYNCGLLNALAALPDENARLRATGAVHKLTSPAEMGELFKVLACGKGLAEPLVGFARHDRLAAL